MHLQIYRDDVTTKSMSDPSRNNLLENRALSFEFSFVLYILRGKFDRLALINFPVHETETIL